MSGLTQVTAKNGSVIVDSTSSTSILSSGAPSITTPELDLSGGITFSGTNPNKATATKTGQTSTPDPLANISAPSSSGMTVQSNSAINLLSSMTRTISPGVYTGGFNLSGSSVLTMNPGVYYINGGGISLSGSAGITGNGVFIYNTGGGAINLERHRDHRAQPHDQRHIPRHHRFPGPVELGWGDHVRRIEHQQHRYVLLSGLEIDAERYERCRRDGCSDHRQGPHVLGDRRGPGQV